MKIVTEPIWFRLQIVVVFERSQGSQREDTCFSMSELFIGNFPCVMLGAIKGYCQHTDG